MTVYYLMLIILLVNAPLYRITCKTKVQKKCWCIFIFFMLFGIMAIRDISIGIDTKAYSSYFMRIGMERNYINIVNAAPIYSIYSKLLYMLFPYENAIVIMNALIVNVSITYFIYQLSQNMVHSACIYIVSYMYLESFNGTRQFMAMGFLLIAYCMRRNARIKSMVIYLILACGIHITSIIFIPFMLINEQKMNKRKTNIMVIAIGVSTLFIRYTLWSLMNFISYIMPKYAKYLKYENFIASGGKGNNIYVTIFYLCFLCIALFLINKNFYKNDFTKINVSEKYSQYLSMIIIFSAVTIIFGLFFSKSLMMNRLRQYFSVFWILLIPSLFELIKNRAYRTYIYALTYIILIIPFTIQLLSNQAGVVPYITYTR